MDCVEIEQHVRQFVLDTFVFGDGGDIDANTSFLEHAIIDSLGVLTLIMFVEEHYGIEVADEDVIPDNFDSIHKLSQYIHQRRSEPIAA